jgi:hypothetical protein
MAHLLTTELTHVGIESAALDEAQEYSLPARRSAALPCSIQR